MLKPFNILDWYLALRRSLSPRADPPSGVLLLSCGGLGDMVLFALVLPRFMELAGEGEKVNVLVRDDAKKMTFLFPPGVEVKAVDFRRLRKDLTYRRQTSEELFQANFRLVVTTDFKRHPFLDEALAAAAAAPETAAMQARSWTKYDAQLKHNRRLFKRLYESGPEHLDKVVRWSNFADWLSGDKQPPPLARLADDPTGPAETAGADEVIVQPFSAVRQKQSPPALYERIAEAVGEGHRMIVTGTQGDLEASPDYGPLLARPNVTFDSSTFEALAPRLKGARLVISVDTALMHLAVALGAPTLCLASAAFVGEIVPYDPAITPENAHFMYHSMPCEGCLGTCSLPEESGAYPCITRLDGDAVVAKVEELLAANSKGG